MPGSTLATSVPAASAGDSLGPVAIDAVVARTPLSGFAISSYDVDVTANSELEALPPLELTDRLDVEARWQPSQFSNSETAPQFATRRDRLTRSG